jgi:hypothetical protein
MMKSKYLNRRTMLKGILGGVGAAIALPTLEAMVNSHGEAYADGSNFPQRFMTFFFGNGFILSKFVPTTEGPGYELSEQLMPLKNVKEYVSVLTGFDNRCETTITHHEGLTVFNGYTMTEIQGLYSKAGGPTIDQVISAKLGNVTSIPSVHVGVSRRLSVMDGGTTMHVLSHKGTNEPQPPQHNPQEVWNALFNSFTPPADPAGPLRVSVLDAVRDNTSALKKRLGVKDNQRLEAHLEGIASLEQKIKALPPVCTKPGLPVETNPEAPGPEPFISTSEAMSDLIAYAFACDVTRVASCLLVGGAAETVFNDLGQNNSHHGNTHNWPGAQAAINAGVIYQMERFAYLLEKLKATPDGVNGNVLDNSIVYMSSDCAEGWSHSVKQQPIIVAGGGGGYLVKPGIHYNGNGGNPSDILLTCLQAFDPAAIEIGAGDPYSNKPLGALKAV